MPVGLIALENEIAHLRGLDAGGLRARWHTTFRRRAPPHLPRTPAVSLDAQYDASQAYIRSQAHAGWTLLRARYDDGGFSGGNTGRPALQRLLEDVRAGKVDVIVVYKVDRLTRSLADFAKLVELFDQHGVSFLSVTQQFNTTTSMGRLTLSNGSSFGSSVIARLQCWRAARWRDGTLPS